MKYLEYQEAAVSGFDVRSAKAMAEENRVFNVDRILEIGWPENA
ncbi:MAG: hypothetical protein V1766_12405 [Pseudomonadota bacterium]